MFIGRKQANGAGLWPNGDELERFKGNTFFFFEYLCLILLGELGQGQLGYLVAELLLDPNMDTPIGAD